MGSISGDSRRYSDVEKFRAGQDLFIIELNGVTSEATNLYDPTWSLLRAYQLLFKQWHILFRNRRNESQTREPTESCCRPRARNPGLPSRQVDSSVVNYKLIPWNAKKLRRGGLPHIADEDRSLNLRQIHQHQSIQHITEIRIDVEA